MFSQYMPRFIVNYSAFGSNLRDKVRPHDITDSWSDWISYEGNPVAVGEEEVRKGE
jgi:hypothetical protein